MSEREIYDMVASTLKLVAKLKDEVEGLKKRVEELEKFRAEIEAMPLEDLIRRAGL